MQAIHLPGVLHGDKPPFVFLNSPPVPSVLQYSTSYPLPELPVSPSGHVYIISVAYTALTRGELTWKEILDESRFHPHGSAIPGHDVVGVITTAIPSSTVPTPPKFKQGHQIWGLIDFDRDGAGASTTWCYESEIALIPPCPPSKDTTQWQQILATLPLSGLTAYQALFIQASNALPRRGHVLVTGATGSVGILAVQVAKASGYQVTALASKRKRDFLLDHVDHFIPYDDPRFTSLPAWMQEHAIPAADVVIDCIGGSTLSSIVQEPGTLNPNGKAITIVAPLEGATFFVVRPDGAQLEELGKLITAGKLIGYVDDVFDLSSGREAMEKVESRRGAIGKVVLRVADI